MTIAQDSAPHAGVYIHWPFCEHKCPYCDFYSMGHEHAGFALHEHYAQALLREIAQAPQRWGWDQPPHVDTIYFGGGTPSLMGAPLAGRILDALSSVMVIELGAEVTLELNPTTAEVMMMRGMLEAGVNRFSLGCQSFDDRILRHLGRNHDAATARRAIEQLRDLGVNNLSVDLIFAAPGQTFEDLKRDLAVVLDVCPQHVSAYNLTIHENTPFDRLASQGQLDLPSEAEAALMMELIIDTLGLAGYEHYEISNWALPGFASRHNSKYWCNTPVIGLGASAHGVWQGQRYYNAPDVAAYIQDDPGSVHLPADPPVDERSRCGEIMMLALRRTSGCRWDELEAWLGQDPRGLYRTELEQAAGRGLVEYDSHTLRLTRQGILLADTAMEMFF